MSNNKTAVNNTNSSLIAFINRRNNEPRKVIEYPVCKAWTDENGEPVKWKIIKRTSKELADIRSKYARINSKGKSKEIDTQAIQNEVMGECIIFPNLKDAALADAVMPGTPLDQRTPGNLLTAIVDDDLELQFLFGVISSLHGWDKDQDKLAAEQKALIDEAKNS